MTARGPAVSVATSVFNAERYLGAAIESVLGQEFGDFEFLLLDDGSTDSSRAIAEDYAARDKRICLTSRENRGLVAARAGAHFEVDVLLVTRVARDEHQLERVFGGLDLGSEPNDFLGAHLSHAGVAVVLHLARGCEFAFERAEGAEFLGDRVEAGVLHRQIAELALPAYDGGIRQGAADFLEAIDHFFES